MIRGRGLCIFFLGGDDCSAKVINKSLFSKPRTFVLEQTVKNKKSVHKTGRKMGLYQGGRNCVFV